MLSRRSFLASSAAGLAASALAGTARAQARPFTFVSWGGAMSDFDRTAVIDPFFRARNLPVVHASPTNYARLRAMVEARAPEWDLVNVGGRFIFEGADFLEPLDMSLIPNARALDPGWVTPRGVFTSTGATIVAWNTRTFPADAGPQSWADFWDVRRFPGPRGLYRPFYYNYEAAMLAAGTPRNQVYPVTPEKVRVVFEKMREIKPHVRVWWTAGAQPPQLLSTGELAMSSAWSGRILGAIRENAPVTMTYRDGIAWGNAYVIVRGSPHARLAMEAINAAVSEETQMRMLDSGTYGPTLDAAAARGTPEQQRWMPTAPVNRGSMLIINEEQAAFYSKTYEEEWNRFLLG
jgi:putative spermidine/putrescine transport system substrate-binding protein